MFSENEKCSGGNPSEVHISHRGLSWIVVIATTACFIAFVGGYFVGKKHSAAQCAYTVTTKE